MNHPHALLTRRHGCNRGAFVGSSLLPRLLRTRGPTQQRPGQASDRHLFAGRTFPLRELRSEAGRARERTAANSARSPRPCRAFGFRNICRAWRKRAHKFNVIRSVHVDSPSHNSSIHQTLTGWPYLNANTEDKTRNNIHPAIGSIVARSCAVARAGVAGLCHGSAFRPTRHSRPLCVGGFARRGLRTGRFRNAPRASRRGVHRSARFELASELTREQLGDRLALRQAFDPAARADGFGRYFRQAQEILVRGEAARAFDLSRETRPVRERYGNHLWGQQTILARRLAEAGVPFTLVNYTLDQARGQDWDTHADNFNELKNRLLPPMDLAVSTLLDDLESRGLLDTTLVAMFGEFGRTPIINNNAGRDHWHNVFSVMLAGGGLRSGVVVGSSTRGGDLPLDRPIHFSDVVATIYHQLGVPMTRCCAIR